MGVMRFQVPCRENLPADVLERTFVSGYEGVAARCRAEWSEGELIVRRAIGDSGNLRIPWTTSGHGELLLQTATLMERDEPYLLPVELARGTISRLRNFLEECCVAGWPVPEPAKANLTAALLAFSRAATLQHDPAAAQSAADEAMSAALSAMDALEPAMANVGRLMRTRAGSRGALLLGVELSGGSLAPDVQSALASTFNCAVVRIPWRSIEPVQGKRDWSAVDRQMEWCRAAGLRICGGPLVELSPRATPDWLYLWEGDEDSLVPMLGDFVRDAVERYRGKVALWIGPARINVHDHLSFSEQGRLRLAVLSIETIRALDSASPVVVQIDQPCGEFMGHMDRDFSPLHFADALVRAELGLAGIGLEFNYGYFPDGTQPIDLVEFSRQVDRWSMLNLPLMVSLTTPSGGQADGSTASKSRVLDCASGEPSPTSQRRFVERALAVLLSKPAVQGVIWGQLSDAAPHDYPHGGLLDVHNRPKPALDAFRAVKESYRL